jgi:hypothetical protein
MLYDGAIRKIIVDALLLTIALSDEAGFIPIDRAVSTARTTLAMCALGRVSGPAAFSWGFVHVLYLVRHSSGLGYWLLGLSPRSPIT